MTDRLIQVCGDPTVDWLSVNNEEYVISGGVYFWLGDQSVPKVRLSSQAGGSALIVPLLQEMIARINPPHPTRVEGAAIAPELLEKPKGSPVTTSWTVWKPYVMAGQKGSIFRLAEWRECEQAAWDYKGNRLQGSPDLLIMEDSGLGFRDCPDGWPEALTAGSSEGPQHIILKLSQYSVLASRRAEAGIGVCSETLVQHANPLYHQIVNSHLASRTTLLTAIGDLRACAVKVGVSLSWEKALEEVVAAVFSPSCPFVDLQTGQLLFHQVIVALGCSAAVIVDREGSTLVFDRTGQEGDFPRRLQGSMMGYNSCISAALAAAWAESGGQAPGAEAVRDGLALARLLHLGGYEVASDGKHNRLRFPATRLAEAYRERPTRGSPKGLPADPTKVWDLGTFVDRKGLARDPDRKGKWSILEEVVAEGPAGSGRPQASNSADAVWRCARRIVTEGPQAALEGVPIETVRGWRSADRHEIEGVRGVNNAMREYLREKKRDKPLCVAVFGPPGAGKSFAVKQIANDLEIAKEAQLTFNLSQFESPRQLAVAFHQIRDLHLKGLMPVVFWDEFDTPCEGKPLGWLRYFLTPMQDGEFTEEGRVHPVGDGIYVFAGATRYSFDQFCSGNSAEELAAKKPDFISRLRAYIDVRGPNGNPNSIEDRMHVIRRAFLLNHFLDANAQQTRRGKQFQVESGVLDAFLRVSAYRHGARSMETLVKMSNLSEKRKYELSSLPPDHILRMHVNADHFNSLTRLGHREMLRVGITGHIGLDPGRMAELEKGVQGAVEFLQRQFPDRCLTVFSPMAKGADRLVARALLKTQGAGLIAVLPLPRDDYMNDFGITDLHHEDWEGAELRKEFRYWLAEKAIEVIEMGSCPTRDDAYLQAGYFIVENSDVMVAVWDGEPSQGKGGTADIVDRAIEMGKPVYHVWAGNFKDRPEKRTDVGAIHGKHRHINFPGQKRSRWAGPCRSKPTPALTIALPGSTVPTT